MFRPQIGFNPLFPQAAWTLMSNWGMCRQQMIESSRNSGSRRDNDVSTQAQ